MYLCIYSFINRFIIFLFFFKSISSLPVLHVRDCLIFFTCRWNLFGILVLLYYLVYMFCSFYLILYVIWFQFSLSLSPFYYFDYYEYQYFTSVLFHMFSFIENALFGSYFWMSHRTFIESSAVTTGFWLDQYGGRFASIFRRCPPSMFWGQWNFPLLFWHIAFHFRVLTSYILCSSWEKSYVLLFFLKLHNPYQLNLTRNSIILFMFSSSENKRTL